MQCHTLRSELQAHTARNEAKRNLVRLRSLTSDKLNSGNPRLPGAIASLLSPSDSEFTQHDPAIFTCRRAVMCARRDGARIVAKSADFRRFSRPVQYRGQFRSRFLTTT